MEEKHLEWEANPKETKQNKIIFKKVAQRSVSPGNPDLVLEQLMGLGGLKLNQCSRILSNYDFLCVCLTLILFPSCGWWVNLWHAISCHA